MAYQQVLWRGAEPWWIMAAMLLTFNVCLTIMMEIYLRIGRRGK